jgi:hypothetical protein
MQIKFAASCSKEINYSDSNEDIYLINEDKGLVALCDGASESFASKCWATQLAEHFIYCPEISPAWVDLVIESYTKQFNPSLLTWSKQASFERGSFSTLLGLEYNKLQNCLEIMAVGDSIAILLDQGKKIDSWPYKKPELFIQNPVLFSSNKSENQFIEACDFYNCHQITWPLYHLIKPLLLLMTDALGEWFLRTYQKNPDECLSLVQMYDNTLFCNWVISQREIKNIKQDDTTLIILEF